MAALARRRPNNPMFSVESAPARKQSGLKQHEEGRLQAELEVQKAVAAAETERKTLQLQMLDLESEVIFEFEELEAELLHLRSATEEMGRQLKESEQKRAAEQELRQGLELQLLQMSDELLSLRVSAAISRSPQHCDIARWDSGSSGCSSASLPEQPDTPEQEQHPAERLGSIASNISAMDMEMAA